MANNNRADRGNNRKRGNVTEAPESKRSAIAAELKIRPKTKALYDKMIDNPSLAQKDAYKELHPNASDETANVNASKLLSSTKYQIYKASVVGKAKRRIASLVDSENENIALKASQDIIDRTEGKATQKTENTSRTVHVALDLTGVKLGGHNLTPNQVQELTS